MIFLIRYWWSGKNVSNSDNHANILHYSVHKLCDCVDHVCSECVILLCMFISWISDSNGTCRWSWTTVELS